MTDTQALRDLEKRLTEATGPDRELDAIFAAVLDGMTKIEIDRQEVWATTGSGYATARLLGWIDPGKTQRNFSIYDDTTPRFTASLDAAIALCERVLPGHSFGVRTSATWADHTKWAGKPVWEAVATDTGDTDDYYPFEDSHGREDVSEFFSKHCHPALALCLATVRALLAKAPT